MLYPKNRHSELLKIKEYQKKDNLLYIHYACSSIKDNNENIITSIAIKESKSNEVRSFNITEIIDEKSMLDDFYRYIKTKSNHYWIHWNMKNSIYGFDAINNRYKELGSTPEEIHHEQKIDLYVILINIYGDNYIDHPHFINIAKKNKLNIKDFIKGEDEPQCFKDKEYQKLKLSSHRKVEIIKELFEKADKLKTKKKSIVLRIFDYIECINNSKSYQCLVILTVLMTFYSFFKK